MKTAVIGVLVLIALLLFVMLRSRRKPAARSAGAAKSVRASRAAGGPGPVTGNPYRSVSIKCGPDACAEVLALGKRRFLTGQLGKLPLDGCTSQNCQCKFEHHPDRRDFDGDKRAPTALRSNLYTASGKPERRTRKGRRKTDLT
jgi:hypothetical protein